VLFEVAQEYRYGTRLWSGEAEAWAQEAGRPGAARDASVNAPVWPPEGIYGSKPPTGASLSVRIERLFQNSHGLAVCDGRVDPARRP
jgi:hypothetical protein